jgi:TonB family protein
MKTIWNLISIVSFGFFVFQIFFQGDKTTVVEIPPIERPEKRSLLYVTEEMPRFPGCENSRFSKNERQSCANKKLLEFVYLNLKYNSKINHNKGTAVVQFTVETDGRLTHIKILKGMSPGLGKDLVDVIKKMPKWVPGKQFGKEIAIRFTLPVKIRLE